MHETQLVRHGMMIVGEAGAGKSTNARLLGRALSALKRKGIHDKDGFFKEIDTFRLNPKAITAGQLYGEFNELSGEWTDD